MTDQSIEMQSHSNEIAELKRSVLILAAICTLAFFLRLGSNGLFDLDEALYANAAREMVLRGDYVSPSVNGAFFFEKPPFVYWCAAAFFHLFGVSELTARLPPAIASTVLVFLVIQFGKRYFSLRAGFLAGAFFALSPIVLGAGRQLTTDAILTLWVSCALACYFAASSANNPTDKRWYYGFWASCGLGVLTKGAPGIILPAAIALIFVVICERFHLPGIFSRLGETRPFTGLALFFAISIPWHVAAWRANGEPFYHEYILRQHLQRFRGGDEAHKLPFWFYIPAFLVGFFPWSVFVIPAVAEKRERDIRSTADQFRLFLKIWCAVVFIAFSVSGSKLVSYILPMYPAAALLVGDWCARASVDQKRRKSLIIGGLFCVAITGILFMAVIFNGPLIHLIEAVSHQPARVNSIPPEMMPLAAHLFGVGAISTAAFLMMVIGRKSKIGFDALIGGMTVFVLVAVLEGLPAIDRQFSAPLREAAHQAGSLVQPGQKLGVFIGEPRRPSVFFYLPPLVIAPNGAGSNAVETTDIGKIEGFLRGDRPLVILTDAKRKGLVAGAPGLRTDFIAGQWSVFRIE